MSRKDEHRGQVDRFRAAAREVGAGADTDRFDDLLKRLTTAPPPDTVQERKKAKSKKKKPDK